MKVVEEFDNKLLGRKELKVAKTYDSNPGKEKVTQDIIKNFKTDEVNFVIKSIKNSFGSNEFVIEVFIYDSEELKKKYEPRKKEKKK